jgi:glucose/mannose-6-phosphate isomerase
VTAGPYLDTLGMWDATAALPEQIGEALVNGRHVLESARLPAGHDINSVALFGMGASATATRAAAAYGAPRASVPIWVGDGYEVPAFVGPRTLVLVVSYSGDTEETLAAATAAHERGAAVAAVSGPGTLERWAGSVGLPHFALPGGLPASRTALGAATVSLLLALGQAGVVPDVVPSLTAARPALARRRDALVAHDGEAAEVARRIGRTIPLMYGSSGLCAVAAERWKTQVNENAKTPAFFAVLPELSHNEVAGWGQHGDVTRQVLTLITLRHPAEHPQVARRFSLVVEALDEVMAAVIPVWAEGDGDLSRFFDLALFGDLVSLHLSGREGIDPGPEPAVADVESGLR